MLIASCACVYASVKTSQGVNNIVKTGGINIDVNTYQTNTDGEIIPLNDTTVVDYYGETEYIPVITNKAEDCYIRLKVNADTETQEINIIENLKGVNDNFKMIDGYLYYTEPLEKDESIELCKSFDVPDEWDYMTSNNLKIQVKVDAIQAKNFYPNFKSSAPWGDVEIYKSNIADDYEVNTAGEVEEEENIKIVYLNHVDGININSDDFFKNITFMPGDKYIDTLTVENNTDEDAKILFKTEYKETPLLNTMDLAIDNGDIFYSGKLASK